MTDEPAATTVCSSCACARVQCLVFGLQHFCWLCHAVPVQHAPVHSRLGRLHANRECCVPPLCPICATTACTAWMERRTLHVTITFDCSPVRDLNAQHVTIC